jgi:hypothetical protein
METESISTGLFGQVADLVQSYWPGAEVSGSIPMRPNAAATLLITVRPEGGSDA